MKVYNTSINKSLHPELQDYLNLGRKSRNFKPKSYLHQKAEVLNEYLLKSNLKACVVAVSGGIDSAVVLGIVNYASQLPNSPIKKIIPVTLPVESIGAVGQSRAAQRAQELCTSWNLKPYTIALKSAFDELRNLVDSELEIKGEGWAQGQLVSYLRTPTLYYINSLMSQQGYGSVICGTTNKSEGAYLGYVGKASDGMVDLQLISDLYKSEVYSLAAELQVIDSIMEVTPSGDMYDSRVDEEVFGTSYDFVELYHEYLSGRELNLESIEAKEQFQKGQEALEKLHNYNAHKYLVGSPAVHLDLIPNKIPGNWGNRLSEATVLDLSKVVNLQKVEHKLESQQPQIKVLAMGKVTKFSNVLSQAEIDGLIQQSKSLPWVKAGASGYVQDTTVGSFRMSWHDKTISQEIFKRMSPYLNYSKKNNGQRFRLLEMAELLRFIRYESTGVLLPHRDLSFKYNNHKQTLQSVVIYLTKGTTRFLKDVPGGDWSRSSTSDEVDFAVEANPGDILIFDHELLHESENNNLEKIIIRSDLVYEKLIF